MKLEMISKYPVGEQHPTPLLFIHGTLHTAACWDVHFLDYFAQLVMPLMHLIYAGMETVTDEKSCAGLELPILLKMWKIQFSNCPAHRF